MGSLADEYRPRAGRGFRFGAANTSVLLSPIGVGVLGRYIESTASRSEGLLCLLRDLLLS